MSSAGGGVDGDWDFTGADSAAIPSLIPLQTQPPSVIPVPPDQSAAFLPAAALGPPAPLQDPGPSDWPAPTLDQMATGPLFRMTDRQLDGIRADAENQVKLQSLPAEILAPLAHHFIEQAVRKPGLAETPEGAALWAIPGVIDAYNNLTALFDGERAQNVYGQAVFKALNGTLNQQAAGQTAQRGHGPYLP